MRAKYIRGYTIELLEEEVNRFLSSCDGRVGWELYGSIVPIADGIGGYAQALVYKNPIK